MEIEFFGQGLDRKIMELKGMKIDPEHREGEAGLMHKRWFDYRGLHPVEATYLYAHFYKEQTLKFYESVIDIRTLENARAFVPDDIFMSRDMTSMWLARRCADEHGLPYPFVLRFAQDRFFNRAQRTFPRPNQLYGEEFEIDLLAAWKEEVSRKITYSTHPRYKLAAWKGERDQAEHLDFVLNQIKARPAPRHRLMARMISEGIINRALIEKRFSKQEADDAERYFSQFMLSQR